MDEEAKARKEAWSAILNWVALLTGNREAAGQVADHSIGVISSIVISCFDKNKSGNRTRT